MWVSIWLARASSFIPLLDDHRGRGHSAQMGRADLKLLLTNCRRSRYVVDNRHAETIRFAARNSGPDDSEDDRRWTAARLGNRQADPGAFRRGVQHRAGLALSGAAPAGTARLDSGRMEGFESGTPGQALFVNARRAQSAGERTAHVGPALVRGALVD